MSVETTVPGVYIEEDASPAISISQGATAVPLFIGKFIPKGESTVKGLIRVSSWLEFTQKFNFDPQKSAIQITSTQNNEELEAAQKRLADKKVEDTQKKAAITTLEEKITQSKAEEKPEETKELEKDLIKLQADAAKIQQEVTALEEEVRKLTAVKKYDYTITDPVTITQQTIAATSLQLYFQNGGNACYIYALDNASDTSNTSKILELSDRADDITLFVVVDNEAGYQSTIYQALSSALAPQKGYFLLADSRDGKETATLSDNSHMAFYYPSLVATNPAEISDANVTITGYENALGTPITTLDALRQDNPTVAAQIDAKLKEAKINTVDIPASAIMAGIYCKTDRERGVWKAPANVPLTGISDVKERVSDDEQGKMNSKGINVIRYFNDRGPVVWGARTLKDDDNWRYIPVRRLFDTAERDIKKSIRPMVFEPNNAVTWKRVQSAIENYLYRIWEQGGLTGNKASDAYFVHIGKGITMTETDINQGKMIVQVGMAAVRPAEFIILQFTQQMSQ